MNYFLQAFGGINFGSVVVFCAAIGGIISLIVKIYKKIIGFHDEIQEKDKALTEVIEKTGELETELEKIVTTQNSIAESIDKISESQFELSRQIQSFEYDMKKQSLNKIRDRLVQSYRYYANDERNPLKAWTEMEKDAFDRLFRDYEELGGDGYIHTVVEPAMNDLEVIEITDAEGVANLMKNRKVG